MLALATLSLLAASHIARGSPLLPPKLEHPTNPASARPASCSRVCPLVNGRGNVLKLLHADYRVIDGIKATVCEYTEDMRCLYDEDYGYMIVRADVNVFECPERDELECEEQHDLNDLVDLRRRAPPRQSQKMGKGKPGKKNTGKQHRGSSNNKKGGNHNQQHRGGNNHNHAAHQQPQSSSSTPVDQLTSHVSHALNGTHSANTKRIVPGDFTETRNTGNAIVHEAASLEHLSVDQVYDVAGEIPQPGLPYVKRDTAVSEVNGKRTLFVRPGSVEGANTNLE